jgi:hypothetical protein
MSNKLILAAALAAALATPLALAQDVSWRVLAGDSAAIVAPGLPGGSRSTNDELLGDLGKGYIGLRMTSPNTAAGYWALRQGAWTQYTKTGVTGSALGPGRTGTEAGHVFLSVNSGGSGAGTDGQRVFSANAGDPAVTTSATWGIWRWDTARNIEIVRALTDGALGPNLGAGWVYQNRHDFASARALNGGQVLVNAYVTSPSGLSRLYLARSVPGQAVTPCAMKDSTDPNLAPGLAAGDTFDTAWSFDNLSTTPSGRVYGALQTYQGRNGIWKLCEGAPQALVVNNETGARGPDIGIATATFATLGTPHPGDDGALFYFATYRRTASESSRTGLFWHDGVTNRPLAINDDAGVYGPGWAGATWQSFDTGSLTSAGEWVAFQGTLRAADGGTPSGLWRVRAGGTPEIVALRGLEAYGPEPSRTWDAFYGNAVLANGDILVQARTMPGSEYALWLLKANGARQRVLKIGQTVSVPTATGVVQGSVSSYTVPSGAAPYSRGGDTWIGADGSLLIKANLTTYGAALITATPSNPIDKIFASGFDG